MITLFLTSFSYADDISINSFDKGTLKVVEGTPFLKLYGNYYEMGVQYGHLLKEPLLVFQDKIKLFKSKITANKYYQYFKNNMPPKYDDFLKGASESSSISYEDLLLGVCFDFINSGCSSILAKIDANGSSILLHAKNRDRAMLAQDYAVIEFNPKGEYRYISTVTIGAIMVHQGLNEKGIAVTLNSAPPSKYIVKDFPKDDLARMILESVKSLNDVDKVLNEYQTDSDGIVIISSAYENNGVIYDLGNVIRIKHDLADKNFLFVTNNFLSDELTPKEIRLNDPRYQQIDGYLKNHPLKSVDEMIDLLALTPVNNAYTIHSIIFNAKQGEIYLAFSDLYAAWSKWLKYDWKNDQVTVYRKPL
jgi:hypothetical protein